MKNITSDCGKLLYNVRFIFSTSQIKEYNGNIQIDHFFSKKRITVNDYKNLEYDTPQDPIRGAYHKMETIICDCQHYECFGQFDLIRRIKRKIIMTDDSYDE